MKNYIYFKTTQCLYKHLLSKGAKFDLNKSLRCSRFTFYVDNKPQHHSTLHSMLKQFNTMLPEDSRFSEKLSKAKGRFGYLVFLEHLAEEVVEPFVPMISLTSEEDDKVEAAPQVEKEAPDWDWISTLENKKSDKKELDLYAEEEFNIKLNKVNTLANMIIDFKEQYSK